MADISISSADVIYAKRNPYGQPEVRYMGEAPSQSFRFGTVVQQSTLASTQTNQLLAASTSGSTCISTCIVGVAAAAATGVQYAKCPFFSASPNNEFWARTKNGTLAESNVGNGYGLAHDSSKDVWLVDLGNTQSTSIRVIVTELVDNVGDSGGAVLFKFGRLAGSTNTFGLGY